MLFQVGCCIKILLLLFYEFYVVSSCLIFASDTKRHKSLSTAMNLSRFVQALQDTAVGVWRTKSSMQRTRPELQRAQRVFSIHMGRYRKILRKICQDIRVVEGDLRFEQASSCEISAFHCCSLL